VRDERRLIVRRDRLESFLAPAHSRPTATRETLSSVEIQ
jgi:hypothetical protein